jgi:hypothetical protein
MSDVPYPWMPIPSENLVPLLRQYADDYLRIGNGFSATLMTSAANELERLMSEDD